jgi:hypothetical protein
VWQALKTELANPTFQVLAVALDRSADDVRPFAEMAGATYPILVDSEHVVADLYRSSTCRRASGSTSAAASSGRTTPSSATTRSRT